MMGKGAKPLKRAASLKTAGSLLLRDLADAGAGRRAMNGTAYRIFKLLAWLMEGPLSVEALNQKFLADPVIGKTVSTDSIWLYINTLKALGCRIQRPCPKNNFQYDLLYHPFGMRLSTQHLEALAQAKRQAQAAFSHHEVLVLDRLLKKIVRHSACEDPQAVIGQVFAQSRSYDYEASRAHLLALEAAIAECRLLELGYQSPVKGDESFLFLPERIFYDQGVVYVRGERPDFDGPSNLRVDRLTALTVSEQPALQAALMARRLEKTEVCVQVFAEHAEAFDGFDLDETLGVYAERCIWQELPVPCYEVRLQVRDRFYLKQRLLSCGYPFRVLAPLDFREEMRQTLASMRQYYQEVPDGSA